MYGDNAETITGNCGNQIFILTNDNKTAEEFSKSLGNTTRLDIQRSGNKFSDSKSFTESTSEEALLTPNQLMGLLPGECVVNRTMKRTDLKGRPVHPYPIFNTKWFGTDLPYSYQYLTEYFPNAGDMSLEEANQEDLSGVSLKAITFDPYVGFARVNEAYQKAVKARAMYSSTNTDIEAAVTKAAATLDAALYSCPTDIETLTANENAEYEKALLRGELFHEVRA